MVQLLELDDEYYQNSIIDINFNPEEKDLEQAIVDICDQVERVVQAGTVLIVLSDRGIAKDKLPIPAAMAVGAVQQRLVSVNLRCDANIVVETASARDPHQFAVLLGFGATAIYPYLAYESIAKMVDNKVIAKTMAEAILNFRNGIQKGLFKIMSKMGISTIASYRCSQLFEAVGLNDNVVNLCFKGVASRIQGADFDDFQQDLINLSRRAWLKRKPLELGGLLKYVHDGEYHAYNPDVVNTLQSAVKSGESVDYKTYADTVNSRPVSSLRDLMRIKPVENPTVLEHVEPASELFKRFDSAAMSIGALSPEAHEALAIAMNRLGGNSNSGEGGEDPRRFNSERNSRIKQIASGRFGVTPHYLTNADVLQIKVAQGAKPGEGGQLPGHKVTAEIARLRHSVQGVTLISPPPHHDIYSIEDLAQLIFDLKQVNPDALVSVKLVSEPGVGTIAVGVAKAYADLITISGYDGGTGASPLTGLAEEVRELMAELGVEKLTDLIGRTDLLEAVDGFTAKQLKLDLSSILESPTPVAGKDVYWREPNPPFDKGLLNQTLIGTFADSIEKRQPASTYLNVKNTDRSIGATLSGAIAKRYGNQGMVGTPLNIQLQGTAGQSLGVWNAGGVNITLTGDANDYVGKGMAGGRIVIKPPVGSAFRTHESTIIEGAGDNACEYMTGGIVAILGHCGVNFGAGMTGGFAYVLDETGDFTGRVNPELVEALSLDKLPIHQEHLRGLIDQHLELTGSSRAQEILADFEQWISKFYLVKPTAADVRSLLGHQSRSAAELRVQAQ
eukprot:snap_masked-scaffold502_size153915-processed-gene-0.12 protein:Tk05902 transcript:snap_masked-scaffold502_size153915-processed-gene-0.12-mRNA-1 annotation:"glutamate synthase"